jgi:hypothetical protein
MKFTVTFKDPDGPYESIQEAAKREVESIQGIDADEKDALIDGRVDKLRAITSAWFEYGEYVRIEIDTEAKTAIVLSAKS